MIDGLHVSYGLSSEDYQRIVALADVCRQYDGIDLSVPLNLPMLQNRPDTEGNDLMYMVEAGKLVGYLGLYKMGTRNELELTGMVHSDFRRQGIFRKLLARAKALGDERGIGRMLLIADQGSSVAGMSAVALGAVYQFSEYRMYYQASSSAKKPTPVNPHVTIEKAEEADLPALVAIAIACFEQSEANIRPLLERNLASEQHDLYVIRYESSTVGTVTVGFDEGEAFIISFCVSPEYQGKGIGRHVLRSIVAMLADRNIPICLDVDVQNRQALGLYESCGFSIASGYDYYLVTS